MRALVHSKDPYVCQNEVTNVLKILTIQNARYIIYSAKYYKYLYTVLWITFTEH